MKKILLASIILMSVYSVGAQNYYITQPEGFDASTTGGGSTGPVTVTTYSDLKAKLYINNTTSNLGIRNDNIIFWTTN
jgi:pectate lyase